MTSFCLILIHNKPQIEIFVFLSGFCSLTPPSFIKLLRSPFRRLCSILGVPDERVRLSIGAAWVCHQNRLIDESRFRHKLDSEWVGIYLVIIKADKDGMPAEGLLLSNKSL